MAVEKLKRIIIAAVSRNGIIGEKGKIPWNNKLEMQHFKNTTLNHPVIMGRLTFESLDKPLTDRLNLVISSSKQKEFTDSIWFRNIHSAYSYLRKKGYKKVFILGGERIFSNTIKHVEEMIISHMELEVKGDRRFPKINYNLWRIKEEKKGDGFTVRHYVRKDK